MLRGLPPATRAACNDASMEEEARLILREIVGRKAISEKRLGSSIQEELFNPPGGVDLELPSREPICKSPQIDRATVQFEEGHWPHILLPLPA